MPACRPADAPRLHPRCAMAVRRASTDRITTWRGRHRSSSRPQVCGNRCSRTTWAQFRRVAARTANSRRAAAAICSVRARARRRITRLEASIAARAMPPHPARTGAGLVHPMRRMETAPSLRPPAEPCVPITMGARVRIWKANRPEPRTAGDSVLSRHPRAARCRAANPIRTRRAAAAPAAATTGTVQHRVPRRNAVIAARRRVPRSSAVTAGMAVTRMAWAVDPRILPLHARN